ncbi:MAG TPA: FAD-dependent oxidoreductase [Anaerolineae bacterium]|nr:FAD-dependent oxidoreductase [Anaerolineae bacterium]
MDNQTAKILVVGAGISGIRAALDFANMGYHVCIIEKSPGVGGILTQLDYQFPDNHCGMCRMLPMIDRDICSQFCLRKGLFHDNITVLTSTEMVSIEGNPGHLKVVLSRQPGGVDPELCSNCGACEKVCPVTVPDTFNAGLVERRAICLPVPHQTISAYSIDWDACTKCGECEKACPAGAIKMDSETEVFEMEDVAVVILATGTKLFNPDSVDLYGYGGFPNVVTSTAFERILSSSGPYKGRFVRPSDGREIKRVAWIQCVGSRNVMTGADYCSNACCMFAIKEALLAREKMAKDAETIIFYMDMRTFGRDFQRYRDRAEKESGVRFVRCRPHSIEPGDNPGDLRLRYVDSKQRPIEEDFDMVVLSTGKEPEQKLPDYAQHEGVFVVESARNLKDISGSVIGAEVAAGRAFRMLKKLGVTPPDAGTQEKMAGHAKAFEDRPLVQVVLCECDRIPDIGSLMDRLKPELEKFPGRLNIVRIKPLCNDKGLDEVKRITGENAANRLLFAACNKYVLRPGLKKLEEDTGLFPSLVEVVDIQPYKERGFDSLIKELEMAISRLRSRRVLNENSRAVEGRALVVGSGPAGLSAALALADNNIKVVLVEKSETLGGNLKYIHDDELKQSIEAILNEVENNSAIKILKGAELMSSFGIPGQFTSKISRRSGGEKTIHHGVTILATGGKPAQTDSYNIANHKRVVTLFEMEKIINDPSFAKQPVKSVVMIQCAGTREEPRNYCSRICCISALNNAMKIKQIHPESEVYIFYRDMMTYGDSESIYTEARTKGIMFIPFDLNSKPEVVIESDGPVVKGFDPFLGVQVNLKPDWISLAVGVVPNPAEDLVKIFGIEITQDGFIKEADSKWRPVDTGQEGVFVCGLARAPARAEEAMQEGEAAAQRALRILSRNEITPQRLTARVRHSICSACGLCIEVCPFNARYMDIEEGKIMVDIASCQGCGACAAICPNSATLMVDFEDDGIMNVIEAAL